MKKNIEALDIAFLLLRLGRSAGFAKKISGVSIAAMVRQKWVKEMMTLNPRGYYTDPETGEERHDGTMVGTGRFISDGEKQYVRTGMSAKEWKRQDRKGYFQNRRASAKTA